MKEQAGKSQRGGSQPETKRETAMLSEAPTTKRTSPEDFQSEPRFEKN
jgi:hypothetical protein